MSAPHDPDLEGREEGEAADEPAEPSIGEVADAEGDASVAAPADDVEDVADPPVDPPKLVDPDRARLLQEVHRLEAQLADREGQLREVTGKLRLVSKAYQDLEKDMDEFRRRVQAQADLKADRRGNDHVARFFAPVQNLVRALAKPGDDLPAFVEGMNLVLQQFQGVMGELGLREAPGVGAPFDPNVHEALALVPTDDPGQDGKVVEVFSTGYLVGDRVVQPGQVVVAKYQEPAEA